MSSDTLKTENRIQMFIYYNTLGWAILAATLAAVTVLGTLPFVVRENFGKNPMFFFFNEGVTALLFFGGILFMRRIRRYALRWIHSTNENYLVSLRGQIDWVEIGPWTGRPPDRAKQTDVFLFVLALLGAVYLAISIFFWYSLGG